MSKLILFSGSNTTYEVILYSRRIDGSNEGITLVPSAHAELLSINACDFLRCRRVPKRRAKSR